MFLAYFSFFFVGILRNLFFLNVILAFLLLMRRRVANGPRAGKRVAAICWRLAATSQRLAFLVPGGLLSTGGGLLFVALP